jgi:hypothetical protein
MLDRSARTLARMSYNSFADSTVAGVYSVTKQGKAA